jgi:hypothetical protein
MPDDSRSLIYVNVLERNASKACSQHFPQKSTCKTNLFIGSICLGSM